MHLKVKNVFSLQDLMYDNAEVSTVGSQQERSGLKTPSCAELRGFPVLQVI